MLAIAPPPYSSGQGGRYAIESTHLLHHPRASLGGPARWTRTRTRDGEGVVMCWLSEGKSPSGVEELQSCNSCTRVRASALYELLAEKAWSRGAG